MSPLVGAVGLSAAGSLGGLAAASLLLLLPAATRTRLVPPLVSYAVGALLGVALVAMLPEAIAMAPAPRVFGTLLGGILLFFVLEKLLLWRHCHSDSCAVHGASGPLVLIGGAVHNFIDGALIGASLVTSVSLGVSAAIAVAAHEVPHEIGDFAVPSVREKGLRPRLGRGLRRRLVLPRHGRMGCGPARLVAARHGRPLIRNSSLQSANE